MKIKIDACVDGAVEAYLKIYNIEIERVDSQADCGGSVLMTMAKTYDANQADLDTRYDKILLCVEGVSGASLARYGSKGLEYIIMPFNEHSFNLSSLFLSLKKKEVSAEALLDEVGIGYWRWMPQINEIYENNHWFKMLGYSKADKPMEDQWFYGLMHEEDADRVRLALAEVEQGHHDTICLNFRLKNKAGGYTDIHAKGKVLSYDGTMKPSLIAGVHVDVSELKATEARVDLLSKAIEVSPVGLILTNTEGLITYVNPTFEQESGYSYQEVYEQAASDILLKDYPSDVYEVLHKRVSDGRLWQGLLMSKRKNGTVFWVNASVSPILDDRGNIKAYVGVFLDVTSNVDKETEMLERNSRLTKQKWVLQELTRQSSENIDGQDPLFKMTEAVTKALNVDMSSIFFFEDMDRCLVCQDAYRAQDPSHGVYDTLNYYEHVNYFMDSLAGAQVILQSNKASPAYDPLIHDLKALDIHDSAHMPIWLGGRVMGILRACSSDHQWLSDEISFLRSVSDLIAIYLEGLARIEAQNLAEKAMTSKTNFLANVSHEIKTPMNAIVGMTHLALQTPLSDQQALYISNIEGASQHLMVLMNDLLDYSKVEVGKINLEHIDFNLPQLFKRLEDMVQYKIKEKALKFGWTIHPKTPLYLVGDPYRLNQILLNLVSNGIKFTPQGRIDVEVNRLYDDATDRSHALLEFKVTDTGIGIEKDQQARMFESFEQGDASTSRKYGGTGLGLAISKALVALYQGHIEVESCVGKGSVFTFTILCGLGQEPSDESLVAEEALYSFVYFDVAKALKEVKGNNRLLLSRLQQYLIYHHDDVDHYKPQEKKRILKSLGGDKILSKGSGDASVYKIFKDEIKLYLRTQLKVASISERIKDDMTYMTILESMVGPINEGFINQINQKKVELNAYWPPLLLWKAHELFMTHLDNYMFEQGVNQLIEMLKEMGVSYEQYLTHH